MPRKRRREKGSGSIYKSGGRWWAQREIAPDGDRRRYERRSHATRAEANATLAAWQAERELTPAARDSFAAYAALWIASRRGDVATTTIEFYERHLGYALPYLGETRLIDIQPAAIRAMLADLDGQLSDRSRAHILKVVSACLQMATDDGIIPRNPCDAVTPPRVATYPARALSDAERAALLAYASPRWRTLWLLAVDLGPRINELLSLRWDAYDSAAATLRIYGSKSGKYRTLPLTAAHVAALEEQRAIVAAMREGAEQWTDHGLIFPSSVGTQTGYHVAQRAFKALLNAAGLDAAIRIHDLRHTAATNLLAAGNDIKTVQAITGHSSASVLLDIYAHTDLSRQRDAIERTERRRTG